jgi:hypothetical protein
MFKAERTVVFMFTSDLLIQVHEYNKVRCELIFGQVAFALALCQIYRIGRAVACFDLNKQFSFRIWGINDQIASSEVCSQSGGVVSGDSIHPAFGSSCSLADFSVGLLFSQNERFAIGVHTATKLPPPRLGNGFPLAPRHRGRAALPRSPIFQENERSDVLLSPYRLQFAPRRFARVAFLDGADRQRLSQNYF